MKLLLDTCAILWLAADAARLSEAARQAISANPSKLFVSAISAFEISLKHRKRRLDLGMEPDAWWFRAIAHHGLLVLPVTDESPLPAPPCRRFTPTRATGSSSPRARSTTRRSSRATR